jgi:hypothetical protein
VKALWEFVNGYKTYIVAVACVVYGILAALGIAPSPEVLGEWLIVVGALAFTFRSTLQKLIDMFQELADK